MDYSRPLIRHYHLSLAYALITFYPLPVRRATGHVLLINQFFIVAPYYRLRISYQFNNRSAWPSGASDNFRALLRILYCYASLTAYALALTAYGTLPTPYHRLYCYSSYARPSGASDCNVPLIAYVLALTACRLSLSTLHAPVRRLAPIT